jgi:flagellar motor switch protein FliN/FliY
MSEESKRSEEDQEVSDGDMTANEVTFADVEPDLEGDNNPQNIDFLLDIPLEITVELGRTKLQIGDLLKLSQGSVVELDKLTNQPLEIFVNKKLMAHGEVVVVNEKFGIRLTNIISPGERVKGLA